MYVLAASRPLIAAKTSTSTGRVLLSLARNFPARARLTMRPADGLLSANYFIF
jgi:hypothetical protein